MDRCKKCNMPNTRPNTVFVDGTCQACVNHEARKNINWKQRKQELKNLCNKYRRSDGYYDCIIPVSGGKDSHMQVYRMKVEMKMNPLLVTINDPFTHTNAGLRNFKNLGETFNCDHIVFNLSPDLFRRVTRIGFEVFGEPLRFIESVIYIMPLKLAVEKNIPLVTFGESMYRFGEGNVEKPSAIDHINNLIKKDNSVFWVNQGCSIDELNCLTPPNEVDMVRVEPNVVFLGYYVPWDSKINLGIAKRYGFVDLWHEWNREGYCECFEQIDSIAYLMHLWMKYPKFGFQRVSDIASRLVRTNDMSLVEAKKKMELDYMLDQRVLDDFCNFCGYSIKEFWDIVDRFWNKDIFCKDDDGIWRIKE